VKVGPYIGLRLLGMRDSPQRWLAQGPMGTVILELWGGANAEVRAQIAKAARDALPVTHPSTVRMLDAGSDDEWAWVAVVPDMAEDLATVAPLPLGLAARVLHDAAEALEHARGRGIFHGALTTRRILVDYDGATRLTGFGAARVFDKDRLTRSALPPFQTTHLSPELLALGPIDAQSDVFSLGRVLAAVAGGVESLPEALAVVAAEACSTDATLRHRTAGAFAEALKAATERELGELPPATALGAHMRAMYAATLAEKQRDWAAADVSGGVTTERQANAISGTWVALAEAFPSSSRPTSTMDLVRPPPRELDRNELERASRISFAVVSLITVMTLAAFLVGFRLLGPLTQTILVPAPPAVAARPVAPLPPFQIPPLTPPDPARWRVAAPVPTPGR